MSRQQQESGDEFQSRYKTLYDSSPIAYFTLSPQGIILNANIVAQKLLGYESKELMKRNITTFIEGGKLAQQDIREIISEVLQGKSPSDIEMKMKRADGKTVWVSVTANLLSDVRGSSHVGFMALDIDKRKAAEARAKEERERANLYMEIMTHDLNNVNQSLLFAMGLLESRTELTEESLSILRDSMWSVRRASRMIANLRALISLREQPPSPDRIDLFPLFKKSLERVRDDIPWKTIDVSTNLERESHIVLGFDQLEQVFFNIIHNSTMFSPHDDVPIEVTAELKELGQAIEVRFTDMGPGMTDAMKEHVFKRTGKPSEQIVGRGLGLTLTASIIESLGGTIEAVNRVEGDSAQGTTIIVRLPAWLEKQEVECGRGGCISFYKSDHCLFCDPVFEILQSVMNEFEIPTSLLEVINIDDPNADIPAAEMPILPFLRICETELSGFVDDEAIRLGILKMMIASCFPFAE